MLQHYFFQMLLGSWGLLKNCAFKNTIKKPNKKPANPTMENVSYWVSGVAEYCICSILLSSRFLGNICALYWDSWGPYPLVQGEVWSHTVYPGNILAELYENFTYVKSNIQNESSSTYIFMDYLFLCRGVNRSGMGVLMLVMTALRCTGDR